MKGRYLTMSPHSFKGSRFLLNLRGDWEMVKLRRSLVTDPETLNDKVQHKSAFDRRQILTTFADKIKVRDYVSRTVGDEYLVSTLFVGHDPNEIGWGQLPEEFVVKVNHGSGGVILCSFRADPANRLTPEASGEGWTRHSVHPSAFEPHMAKTLINRWLSLTYYWYKGCNRIPEWAYRNIRPGVLIEELLDGSNRLHPTDYKFHIFRGNCEFINVINRGTDSATGVTRIYSNPMTTLWEPMNFSINGNPPLAETPEKPEALAEMLEVATALASHEDYARVDLYYTSDKRIKFGEITNYPGPGNHKYDPEIMNSLLGQKMKTSFSSGRFIPTTTSRQD